MGSLLLSHFSAIASRQKSRDMGVFLEMPYNKSVKAINEWQQKANTYNTCLINEANSDNALIAKVANEEQSRLRAAIEKIKTETMAAKAKLDSK